MSEDVMKDIKEAFEKEKEKSAHLPEEERLYYSFLAGVLFYSNRVMKS